MTATNYVFDGFTRVCDICGRPREKLVVRDGVAICDRHPGYRRAQELDRLNARVRIPIERPVKNTKPLSPSPTYLAAEGAVFDLVVNVAPYETFDTTSDGAPGVTGDRMFSTAAWAMIYLLGIVSEGRRPAAWRTQALAKATELGDYLIAHQLFPAGPSADIRAGVFSNGGLAETYFARDYGLACVAMVRLHRETGLPKYLASAKQCADVIVNMQAGNLVAGGPAVFYGPPAFFWLYTGSIAFTHQYWPGDLVCAWGMSELLAADGDGTYGAPVTHGVYSAAPARLLSAAIAQQKSYWATYLTASDPHSYFDVSSLAWKDFTTEDGVNVIDRIDASDWCLAIRALFEMDGVSAQVAALWDYLMSYGSNNHFEPSSTLPDKLLLRGALGTYDPTIAPSASLDTGSLINSDSYYSWAAAGNLAGVQASRGAAGLAAAKAELAVPRHRTAEGSPRDGRTQYLGRLGYSGLSFQPYDIDGARKENVSRAAQVGNLFRYRQAFGGSE